MKSKCQFLNLRLTTTLFRDKCYLCSGSQTLAHPFVECDFSKVFWLDFNSWWNCKNNTQIKLQQPDILFTFDQGKQSFSGIIYCLLVARNYIYIYLQKMNTPSVLIPMSYFLKKKARDRQKKRFEILLLFRELLFCFDDHNSWIL